MKHNGAASLKRSVAMAACALLCAAALAGLAGCGAAAKGATAASNIMAAPPSGADYVQPAEVTVPYPAYDGIDTSGVDGGWVFASAWSDARLKFQVTCGDMTYNYDLPNDGTPTAFPINMGDGYYQFRVMMNTEGNNYVELNSTGASVALWSEFAPFLVPNQFCNYTPTSACVEKARELTADSTNEGEAVQAICMYVAQNTSYDKAKAEELKNSSGYIPFPDDTLATHTGICFDYASLSAAMLRSMGFPTKVVTGYVGDEQLYHAWIMVYADGDWHTAQFSVNPNEWSRCDVTFASTGSTQYTGSGSGYTDKYTY